MRQMKFVSVVLLCGFFLNNSINLFAASEARLTVASIAETSSPRVTMSVDGVPLKDVLKALSEQTGFNYVASQEVEAKSVSFNFNDVPIQDALRSLAEANDVTYEKKPAGNVVLFYAARSTPPPQTGNLETRVYRLKYARLSISPIDTGGEGTIKDLSQQAALGAAGGGGGEAASAGSSTGNLVAARGVDKVIASLLTPAGTVTSDVRTNSLIITDTPEKLAQIEKVLVQIDKPSAQVVIEVYLMEVRKNILVDQGVEWGGAEGQLASFTGGSRTTAFPFAENIFKKSQGVKATTQGTSTLTLGTLSAASFTATLHMLIRDTRTKILARPRVLTLNNEAANIKLVTDTAIANQTQLTSAQGQASSVTNTAVRAPIGILMKMTPQINEDDSVELFVEPSFTTASASSFFPGTFIDPTTRSIRTVARLKNHQTLVIGGLIDRNKETAIRKIPVLGDLPLVGSAFSYRDGSDLDRELLIFITPHIVTQHDSFGPDNATSFNGTDLTARRVLDEFMSEELTRNLDSVQEVEKEKLPVVSQERQLIKASAKMALTPTVEKEMTRSLDAVSRKK